MTKITTNKLIKPILLTGLSILGFVSLSFAQETLMIKTAYPSPAWATHKLETNEIRFRDEVDSAAFEADCSSGAVSANTIALTSDDVIAICDSTGSVSSAPAGTSLLRGGNIYLDPNLRSDTPGIIFTQYDEVGFTPGADSFSGPTSQATGANGIAMGDTAAASGAAAAAIGGMDNSAASSSSFVGGGNTNVVGLRSSDSVIAGGTGNNIVDSSVAGIIASETSSVTNSAAGVIFGGRDHALTNATDSFVIGGDTNTIDSLRSGIIGGDNNSTNGHDDVIIIGASGLSASLDSTVYVGSRLHVEENSIQRSFDEITEYAPTVPSENVTTISGHISSAGAIISGTGGFTAARRGVGLYRITVTPGCQSAIIPTASVVSGGGAVLANVGSFTTTTFDVSTLSALLVGTDNAFTFQANILRTACP